MKRPAGRAFERAEAPFNDGWQGIFSSKWLQGIAAGLAFAGAAAAQAPADLTAAMKLTGEARTRALVEGARKEGGAVMVYHSTQTEDLQPVFDAFTRKYGIKV